MSKGKVRFVVSVWAGYSFFFKNLLTILRVAWLPGLLIVFAGIYANEIIPRADITTLSNGQAKAFMFETLQVMLAYSLFQLLMTLIVVVGIYRIALHDFKPKGPGYLRLRSDEFRVAGVWFLVVAALYIAFMALLYGVIMVAAGYIGVSEGHIGWMAYSPGGGGLAVWFVETLQAYGGVLFVAYLGLAIWIMFWVFGRLFFAMPAALNNRATSIPQVWTVTRGNGLRMILYQIILIISLAAFGAAVYILFYLLPATVAGAILIAVLDGPAIEAVSLKAKDIEAIVMGWPPIWILITSGLVQIFMFLLYISGWAIVVGSASQAFRDMWPDRLEPENPG